MADGGHRGEVARMQRGERVQVWNKFLGTWSGPFEVVEVTAEGAEVRRPGDREPLPNRFPHDQVRGTGTPRPGGPEDWR
jgi:hypothetical protein